MATLTYESYHFYDDYHFLQFSCDKQIENEAKRVKAYVKSYFQPEKYVISFQGWFISE